ncbi:MAG: WG repeat-containing protein [Cyanobacteria bacterium TGS_CYA1]|nr:WG repeat-containing protein [Cyanobacteria bacterium TGS_CYA1]
MKTLFKTLSRFAVVSCVLISFISSSAGAGSLRDTPLTESVTLIDRSGKEILQANHHLWDHYNDGLVPYVWQGDGHCLFGYLNKSGKVAIKPQFYEANPFSEGRAITRDPNGDHLIIDREGHEVKRFKDKEVFHIRDYKNGFAVFRSGNTNRVGCLNLQGDIVIKPEFKEIGIFEDGVAQALQESGFGWGVIDTKGNWIIKPVFSQVGSFDQGVASCEQNGLMGLIDLKGNWIVAPKYAELQNFKNGLAAFRSGTKWGFIDKTGNEVIPPKFDFIMEGFVNNLAVCAVNSNELPCNSVTYFKEFAKYDKKSVLAEPARSEAFVPSAGDFIRPKLKFGLVNRRGDWVIQPKYDSIQPLEGQMRMVCLNGKYGYLDESGKEIVQPKYTDAKNFSDGVALVSMGRMFRSEQFYEFDAAYAPTREDDALSQTPTALIDFDYLETCLAECKKAAQIKPRNATIYSDMGWYNYALNRNDEAIRCYDEGLRLKPKYVDLYLRRGKVFLRLKRWKEAENDFSKCLSLRSEDKYFNVDEQLKILLGICYLGQENWEKAMESFSKFGMSSDFVNSIENVDLRTSHAFSQELITLCEKVGNLKAANWLLSRSMNSCPDGVQMSTDIFRYPCSDSQLLNNDKQLEEKLLLVLRDENATKYQKSKALILTINSKRDLSSRLAKEGDLQNSRKILERQIELFKTLQEYGSPIDAIREEIIAKLRLADLYAVNDDKRCLQLYKEVQDHKLRSAWSIVAACKYGEYQFLRGDKSIAQNLLKNADVYSVNTEVQLALDKFARLDGKEKIAHQNFRCSRGSDLPNRNSDVIIGLMPEGSESAEEYFELAKASEAEGFETSARRFCEKAYPAANSDLKKKIDSFKSSHLSMQKVAYKPMARFLNGFQGNLNLVASEAAKETCKTCIAEEPAYLAPYVSIARIFRREGNYTDAQKYLETALSKNPNYFKALEEKKILDSEVRMVSAK